MPAAAHKGAACLVEKIVETQAAQCCSNGKDFTPRLIADP
jgi:hypothetical protein